MKNTKKYTVTKEKKVVDGVVVRRIRALRSFSSVIAGDFGGYVEDECNLAQTGNCWIFGNAVARGNARVCDDAELYDTVDLCGDSFAVQGAIIKGNIRINGNAIIS